MTPTSTPLEQSIHALSQTPGTCPEATHLIEAARQVNAGETTFAEVVAGLMAPECAFKFPGWKCTRGAGHTGPCAAFPVPGIVVPPLGGSDSPTHITFTEPWIGVDLDATLAHYDHWRGIHHIGAPILPMLERVKQYLQEGNEVRILTARVGPQRHDVPHTIEEIKAPIEAWCLQHLGQVLPITCQKDYNMAGFYDDRCVQVFPNTGETLEDAIADLNQRLIDRTTGFMQQLGQQSLEINRLQSALQSEQEMLSGLVHVFDTPKEGEYVPSHLLTTALRQREAAHAQIKDNEEVLADFRRLTRELDIALSGEAGAAQQASLCDLIGPAQQMRSALLHYYAADFITTDQQEIAAKALGISTSTPSHP